MLYRDQPEIGYHIVDSFLKGKALWMLFVLECLSLFLDLINYVLYFNGHYELKSKCLVTINLC